MPSQAPAHPPTLPDVVRDVVVDFAAFARPWVGRGRPPAFPFIVWLAGMDAVAAMVEMRSLGGDPVTADWFHAWLRIVLGGIPAGVLRYVAAGTVFFVAARAAGARARWIAACDVFACAMLPVAVIDLGVKVVQMLVYGNAFFVGRRDAFVDAVLGMTMFGASILGLRLCWVALTAVFGAPRVRAAVVLVAGVAVLIVAALFGALAGGSS